MRAAPKRVYADLFEPAVPNFTSDAYKLTNQKASCRFGVTAFRLRVGMLSNRSVIRTYMTGFR